MADAAIQMNIREGSFSALMPGAQGMGQIVGPNIASYAIEVVKSLGLYENGGVIRTGPVHYNSIEEIKEFLKILESILTTKQ